MVNPIQLIQLLRASNNPQQIIQQQLGNNPMFQRAMQMAQGKNEEQIKQIVMNVASQRGMDISQLNSMLNQFGVKL